MRRIKAAALIVSLHAALAVGLCAQQDDAAAPQAEKVDAFATSVNCEDVLARLDHFFTTSQNNPSAICLIAVYGRGGKPCGAAGSGGKIGGHTLTILSRLESRSFDQGRVDVARVESGGEPRIEFWLVPAGAERPLADGVTWSYKLPAQAEPLLLGTEYSDGVGGGYGDSPQLYDAFLRANPAMRGNVVIGASSPAAYRRRARERLDELARMGVVRRRLIAFFVRVKPNLMQESVEY